MVGIPLECAINYASEVSVATDASGIIDLGEIDSNRVAISGTNPIASFGDGVNLFRIVRYLSATPLTNSAALVLMNGSSRTAAPGDVCYYVSDDDGNWREIGKSTAASGVTKIETFTASGTWTRIAGTQAVIVLGVGGGADGSAAHGSPIAVGGDGGASAGLAISLIDVSATATATVTIGSHVDTKFGSLFTAPKAGTSPTGDFHVNGKNGSAGGTDPDDGSHGVGGSAGASIFFGFGAGGSGGDGPAGTGGAAGAPGVLIVVSLG